MSVWHVVHIMQELANGALAVALLGGGALLAKRSIPAATWVALAGFAQGAGDLLQNMLNNPAAMHMMELYGPLFMLITIAKAALVFGALAFAIRLLPSRSS